MDDLQSPRSMVNAVFAEAMKEQQAVTAAADAATAAALQETTTTASNGCVVDTNNENSAPSTNTSTSKNDSTSFAASSTTAGGTADTSDSLLPSPNKRAKNSSSTTTATVTSVDEFRDQIETFWKEVKTGADLEIAFNKTMELNAKQTQGLIQAGLDAFHRVETLTRSHTLLQDEVEKKAVELQRLRVVEEKNRSSISNLLRAVETAKAKTRDASRAALSEASLRAELAAVVTKKNEALGLAEEYKRKNILLEEEIRHFKTKLMRATQNLAKMERDQRATLSLAKSINQYHHGSSASSSSSGDVEFYKRKVADLTGRHTAMTGLLAEKNRQIDELRAQTERSMSQNRLAAVRGGKSSTSGRKRPL